MIFFVPNLFFSVPARLLQDYVFISHGLLECLVLFCKKLFDFLVFCKNRLGCLKIVTLKIHYNIIGT